MSLIIDVLGLVPLGADDLVFVVFMVGDDLGSVFRVVADDLECVSWVVADDLSVGLVVFVVADDLGALPVVVLALDLREDLCDRLYLLYNLPSTRQPPATMVARHALLAHLVTVEMKLAPGLEFVDMKAVSARSRSDRMSS